MIRLERREDPEGPHPPAQVIYMANLTLDAARAVVEAHKRLRQERIRLRDNMTGSTYSGVTLTPLEDELDFRLYELEKVLDQ